MQTQLISPKELQRNPWNSNRVSPENMAKLKASIADLGFVSAVVVRELPTGELQILGGQHRVETAVEMGLKEVPCINVGRITDAHAKKIGLVDNARYGIDDTISLAKIFDEIGMTSDQLAEFLPFTEQDFESITKAVSYDLDNLDMLDEDDMDVDVEEVKSKRVEKTHDVLKFRVTLADAERIRQRIESTMKSEGLVDDDELTAAGSALALLLLSKDA